MTDLELAAAYNDPVAYPRLSDIASAFGVAVQTVKNRLGLIRHKTAQGREAPALVERKGIATTAEPVGVEIRDIETVIPSYEEPIEDLLARAMDYTDRVAEHHQARNVIDIRVKVDGPIGVVGIPDHHLNNIGTELRRAFNDAQMIRDTEGLFAVGIGDWIDNFIVGRLERERRKDIMSHSDSWRLMEHYVEILAPKLIAAISGNHNDWAACMGGVDVTRKIFEQMGLGPIYDTDEIRVRLNTPSGRSFTHLARHKYRGHSKYNSVHAILVRMLEQWEGEDVVWGGHIHTAGHMSIEKAWLGDRRVVHGVQLGSYKAIDNYARQEAFRRNQPFMAPVVIHDPATGATHFHEDLAHGVWVLGQMRAAWAAGRPMSTQKLRAA